VLYSAFDSCSACLQLSRSYLLLMGLDIMHFMSEILCKHLNGCGHHASYLLAIFCANTDLGLDIMYVIY
jgi:hypothetical protein